MAVFFFIIQRACHLSVHINSEESSVYCTEKKKRMANGLGLIY